MRFEVIFIIILQSCGLLVNGEPWLGLRVGEPNLPNDNKETSFVRDYEAMESSSAERLFLVEEKKVPIYPFINPSLPTLIPYN